MGHRILVVDDEQSMRDFLTILLQKEGYEVKCEPDGQPALERLKNESFDLVISDVRMSNMDGMRLLKKCKLLDPNIEVIVITAHGSTSDAIVAMKDGAYDYINKPFKLDEIKITIQKALEKRTLAKENSKLRQEIKRQADVSDIIGKSSRMTPIFERIAQIADTKTTVLITGESGTGKELVARAIHSNSIRRSQPFVSINCGAIPSELMESELFGHMRGSFTGSVRDKEGLFLTASNGTLFLDEVFEMPPLLQVKLLRALQEKKIMPIGSNKEVDIDTRVIAATNRDPLEEVKMGRFREDLYYRLNVIQIRVPPLRERRDDIPLLVNHFITRSCEDMAKDPMRMSEATMMILETYDFPGNVRELSNLIERAVALETSDQIRPQSLPGDLLERYTGEPEEEQSHRIGKIDFSQSIDLDKIIEEKESDLINQAIAHANGTKTEAAKLLGISFRSLRYRLKKLGIASTPEGEK